MSYHAFARPFPSEKRKGGETCNLWLETVKTKKQRLLNTIISVSFFPSEVNYLHFV